MREVWLRADTPGKIAYRFIEKNAAVSKDDVLFQT